MLRAEVRGHADAFLETYPAHGRLPRRALLGAFTDGIDTGLWLGGDPAPDRLPAEAALVLPAGSSPLLASTIAVLVDGRGRRQVTGGACRAATTSRSTRSPGPAARARGSRPRSAAAADRTPGREALKGRAPGLVAGPPAVERART